MKFEICCDWCGKVFRRYPSRIREHNFCSQRCSGYYSSKRQNPEGYAFKDFSKNSVRFTQMNREMNSGRMTPEVRMKLRDAKLGTGKGGSYEKFFGRHTHRVVAELMLGRPLKPGEVVHHIDRDRRNNRPENLMVFASQAEHVKWHKKHDNEEVMPDVVQTT